MKDYMRLLIYSRKNGETCGIPSYCTANPLVLEACIELGKRQGRPVLIEATANQVNQFGGYTGMHPADFRNMVYSIADKVGFDRNMLILGGDHLGPLTWDDLPEAEAMANAEELVREYVEAGFKKIHLDTSMRLGSDPVDRPLTDSTIARRGAQLYAVCERTYQKMFATNPDAQRPSFVIGSEVPIPGGAQSYEEEIQITKPCALENTLKAYEDEFKAQGVPEAFENIIGVVVQPGVEFGDDSYFQYDSQAARDLVTQAHKHQNIVLEGHSTDYQPPEALKSMVEDGIAILKVGPALTFALREGLFALSMIEKELIPIEKRAFFPEVLEAAMLGDPSKWEKHYHGTVNRIRISRKYSYSDRCRYYLTVPEVDNSIRKLLENMEDVIIPMGIMHQYMPMQYDKVINGVIENRATALVKDFVVNVAETYTYAAAPLRDAAEVHI